MHDGHLQQIIGDGRHQEHAAIDRGRQGLEKIIAQPRGRGRNQRQPEQQVRIGPQDEAIDPRYGVQQMVMVVPVDGHIDEAQHIAHEARRQRLERGPIGAVRDFQLQHHDGDDDSDDAVAECGQPVFAHQEASLLRAFLAARNSPMAAAGSLLP
jgi:hypothetical protein